ncbi:MAG: hypothetical protein ACKPAE_03915, partial [Microcystis panniformis]
QLWQLERPRHPQIEFAYSSRFTSRRQEILTDKPPLAGFASRYYRISRDFSLTNQRANEGDN